MPDETSTNNESAGGTGEQGSGGTPPTWDQIVEGLPEAHRTLYDAHEQGLRSAIQSERDQRDSLSKQLRKATETLKEGTPERQEFDKLAVQLEAAQRRADFAEEAVKPEIGCTNVRLAFLAAQEFDLIDRRGRINWEQLKKDVPELFRDTKAPPPGNGGRGSNNPPTTMGMTQIIRRGAGYQS